MSYGRIRTPRIYTSTIYHAVSTGKASLDNLNIERASVGGTDVTFNNSGVKTDIFDGKPYKLLEMATSVLSDDIHISFDTGITTDANQDSNFVAILGHNLEAVDGRFYVKTDDASAFSSAAFSSTFSSAFSSALSPFASQHEGKGGRGKGEGEGR